MEPIKSLSQFQEITRNYSSLVFYRGECEDYGDTSCVAKAIRDSSSYDLYGNRLKKFDRKVRESALLDKPADLVPFAQHSGLATKLLDISSNALVALYFACQLSSKNSDGYIYIFDDYAEVTDLLEKYPNFDLEEELLRHLNLLDEQKREIFGSLSGEDLESGKYEFDSVFHDELKEFGKSIEEYRNKYIQGGYSSRTRIRGIDSEDSSFKKKYLELYSLLEGMKKWEIEICSKSDDMKTMFFPKSNSENSPAIDYLHQYKEKRYHYYNEQYKGFDIEVKEYLISLECLIAFINDRSPVGNLASMSSIKDLTMDFLPNLLYQPILTFKRGLSQQSAFFVQTLFDKHELHIYNDINDMAEENGHYTEAHPRELLKCRANYSQKIVIDRASKASILSELDKIGFNKATMFGDADHIAAYIMDSKE